METISEVSYTVPRGGQKTLYGNAYYMPEALELQFARRTSRWYGGTGDSISGWNQKGWAVERCSA